MVLEVTEDGELELVAPFDEETEARRLYQELTGQPWNRETCQAARAEAARRIKRRRQRERVPPEPAVVSLAPPLGVCVQGQESPAAPLSVATPPSPGTVPDRHEEVRVPRDP